MTTDVLSPERIRAATAPGHATTGPGHATTARGRTDGDPTGRTPPPPLTHRAPALDGLRTIAILAVILYHLHIPQLEGGFIGVTVFFVLSGFLITTLLLGERRRTGRVRLGSFWLKRLLRLYPALLVFVAVGLLLWNWVGDYKGASFSAGEAGVIALTYTGNLFRAFWDTTQGVFAHTWSLSMEEQFYLVWPPVLVLLAALRTRRRWLVTGLGVLVVGASAASWASYRTPSGGATPTCTSHRCSASCRSRSGARSRCCSTTNGHGSGQPGSPDTSRPGSASVSWWVCSSGSTTTGRSTPGPSVSSCRSPD